MKIYSWIDSNISYIFYSKYSNIKLGGPNEKPEYSDMSWFAMLMAAGMTNATMLYTIFEPVHHYTSRNKYSADPTTPDNELAQSALMVSFFHYGLYGLELRYNNSKFIHIRP